VALDQKKPLFAFPAVPFGMAAVPAAFVPM
jgi:hypothetical protein